MSVNPFVHFGSSGPEAMAYVTKLCFSATRDSLSLNLAPHVRLISHLISAVLFISFSSDIAEALIYCMQPDEY